MKYSKAADIGCGAGHSIDGLKSISYDIVGVEPGDQLRHEAEKKYRQYLFVNGTGDNTNLEDSSFDLITVATAFYWMNRKNSIKEFSRILKNDGKVALYRYRFPRVESNENCDKIILDHCDKFWNKFREERLVQEDDSDVLLKESSLFGNIEKYVVKNIIELSIEDFVGFLQSTSYVSKYLEVLGNKRNNYLENLVSLLKSINESSMIKVNFDIHIILATKI